MRSSWKPGLAAAAFAGVAAIAACEGPPPAANTAANAAANTTAASNAAPTNAASAGPSASGPDAAAVQAFLTGLYAHYRTSKDNTFQMFDANAKEVFDADTLALMKTLNQTPGPDEPVLDGDWLCNCQDFTSIVATITVQSATATTATASADYHDTGDPTRPPDHDDFQLTSAGGVWRIHDITTRGDPESLRQTIQKAITDSRNGHAIDDAP